MKLRNKKTGEIIDLARRGLLKSDNDNHIIIYPEGALKYYSYDSLAELIADWEDVEPAEPLIKDEKIRKAVRAWAEACCIEIVEITHSRKSFLRLMSAIAGDDEICIDRDIGQTLDERVYNIDELCGEEEE